MTLLPEISYRRVSSWDTGEILSLYRVAGWWDEGADTALIPSIIAGSYAFVVATDREGSAIGMGRVLSDGISDAYIQDVVVAPACRGQGIGKGIIRVLIDICLAADIGWIALIGEPGTEAFYLPLGFSRMEEYIPMKYDTEKNHAQPQ
ncbi:GCN5 family acetyltransferase [Methanomicrobiaceae archaeon CYW5]|uniref:GNAT family N-acetyltransferase n=1 Tax=Methanovulcanius yangii TaxID=1789227 RepID=UPI0029C9EC61|nr:GNAT family N-acetyltransferase [Methanovulcanius yangii]MBT8507685.1 GCN5 family acetyltransferase [Methanovulcanius yangii]